MISCIYQIKNKLNGKIYIGSAKNFHVRKLKHLNYLKHGKHHCRYLQFAWNKYGSENFEFIILEECEKEKLVEREQYWFDYLQPYNRKIGYNISPTAGNTLGTERTDEQKLKLSLSQRGHKHTEETKLKWSEQRTGKEHSKEARINMSKAKKEMSPWNCPDGSRCKCEICLPIRKLKWKEYYKRSYEKTKKQKCIYIN